MRGNRFVKPEVRRLYLADVHVRAHESLVALKGDDAATPEQIARSEASVAAAVELGDYIDVKRRLNTGERQEMLAKMTPYVTPGELVRMESRQVLTAKVVAYLLGWSLADDDGTPVPYSPNLSEAHRLATINSLDPDTFREIKDAIDAHEDAEDAAREKEKNGRSGENVSAPNSPSPSTTVGATATSTS